jgi:hypothetical protein
VQWGLVSGKLDQTATGSVANYGSDGFHHSVVVKGIAPFTKVYYTCGDAAGGISAEFSTTTSRAPGDTTPFTVSIVGDMGTINGQASTAGLISSQASADFTWHIGDISYADDTIETYYEATWNDYMNRVQPFAANQGALAWRTSCPGRDISVFSITHHSPSSVCDSPSAQPT